MAEFPSNNRAFVVNLALKKKAFLTGTEIEIKVINL